MDGCGVVVGSVEVCASEGAGSVTKVGLVGAVAPDGSTTHGGAVVVVSGDAMGCGFAGAMVDAMAFCGVDVALGAAMPGCGVGAVMSIAMRLRVR